MLRFLLKPAAVALGLIAAGASATADDAKRLGRYTPDDAAAADQAAADDDTELVRHGYRYGYPGRGYYGRGYYGGYGRGYYGGYGRGFPGGYYGGYRPGFSFGFSFGNPGFYAPRYYYPRPFYGYGYSSYSYYGGFGGYCPIGGGGVTGGIALGLVLRPAEPVPPAVVPERELPSPFAGTPGGNVPGTSGGTFRYDGGPADPVPMPTPDVTAPAERSGGLPFKPLDRQPQTDTLYVSHPAAKPAAAKPAYRYPAYGEKR